MKEKFTTLHKKWLAFRHKLHWEDYLIKVVEQGEVYSFCTECGWRSEGIKSPPKPNIRSRIDGDPMRHALPRPRLIKFKRG